jgi:hypothetical protein
MRALPAQVRQFPAPSATSSSSTPCRITSTSAAIRNKAGNWVKGSIEGVTDAAATAKIPADYRVSITNAPGPNAYPISSFTYLLIPTHPTDASKEKVIKDMLSWIITSGESEAPSSLLCAASAGSGRQGSQNRLRFAVTHREGSGARRAPFSTSSLPRGHLHFSSRAPRSCRPVSSEC